MSIQNKHKMKSRWYLTGIFLLMVTIASCGKMDATYQSFIKDGSIVYPGKADSVKVFSGKERLNLSFLLMDPKVTRAKILWNNGNDSIILNNPATSSKIPLVIELTKAEHQITEKIYLFEIYTFDKKGNRSIKQQAQGNVYGSIYESSLLARPIERVTRTGTSVQIDWFDALEENIEVELEYINTGGLETSVKVLSADKNTVLLDFKAGNAFKYRSVFLPDSTAIDTFKTGYTEVNVN